MHALLQMTELPVLYPKLISIIRHEVIRDKLFSHLWQLTDNTKAMSIWFVVASKDIVLFYCSLLYDTNNNIDLL